MRIKVSPRRRLPALAPAAVIRCGDPRRASFLTVETSYFFGRKRTGKCRNKSFR